MTAAHRLLSSSHLIALATALTATSGPAMSQEPQSLFERATVMCRNLPTATDPAMYFAFIPNCVGSQIEQPASIERVGSAPGIPYRVLWELNPPRPAGACNPYRMLSDLVADESHLYFVDNQGPDGRAALWRRSRDSNRGDDSTFLRDLGTDLVAAELCVYSTVLFAILHRQGQRDALEEYVKDSGELLAVVETGDAYSLSNLQQDGRYLYWLNLGALRRNDLTNGVRITAVSGPIQSYHLEGYDRECSPLGCEESSRLLYSRRHQLFEVDTLSGVNSLLYTSSDANATILAITRDATRLFFLERRAVPGGGLDREDRFLRLGVSGGTADLIYGPVNNRGSGFDGLTSDNRFLYFRNRANQVAYRLPNNASAITQQKLVARGLEVTQGIQARDNRVRLIANRRTFVRFYVKSEGPADVTGVSASLQGSNGRGFLGSLQPINRIGKLLTVKRSPLRSNIDDAFLFELPLAWTTGGDLDLAATVNPGRAILEDVLGDNSSTLRSLSFSPAPRLAVAYVHWSYALNGVVRTPAPADVEASQDWLLRTYPVPVDTLIENWTLRDDAIASRVARTDPDCARFRTATADDRNLCAAAYAGERIAAARRAGALTNDRIWYVNIAQAADVASTFTRGFSRGDRICMGPSGPATDESFLTYAAHEVGHELGRGHPAVDANSCGHSLDDDSYPYLAAWIGPLALDGNETNVAGFDPGASSTAPFRFLAATSFFDIMGYCRPTWISDYTYEGMYNRMRNNPIGPAGAGGGGGEAAGAGGALEEGGAIPGDWLIVTGTFDVVHGSGGFGVLRRVDSVVDATPPEAGGLTLELAGSDGTVLASHGFSATPMSDADPGQVTFDLVVPFEPGTSELRAIDDATGSLLAASTVSASPPAVFGVGLAEAPSPIDGTVSVSWAAEDADGDPLAFDLLLSRDGGTSFEPVVLSLDSPALDLDTTTLPGGTAILRVVATDGVHTAYSDSALLEIAPKPPVVAIRSPEWGQRVQWNQLVTMEAAVDDVQDRDIPETSIVWATQYGPIGTGRLLQADDLPVGDVTVTVTVTNSFGLAAEAATLMQVVDELSPPGPTLSVSPRLIAWHVADAEATVQEAMLSVSTAGSGEVTFDVASDAEWLLVNGTSAVSGLTSPDSLMVTADPNLLPPGITSAASITIQSLIDPLDTAVVTVRFSKGNVFDQTGEIDTDEDGFVDAIDNCRFVFNPDQTDSDADGIGDACVAVVDADTDGDGVSDASDNCASVPNADQLDSDADGIGDACAVVVETDTDGDGFLDAADNCALVANPDQHDSDADGIGDACAGDLDGDGIVDERDNCPATFNADQLDSDADGIGDACAITGSMQLPGDCNQDGALNISDAVCLLGHLFLGSPSSLPCEGGTAADPGNDALVNVNGDGRVDLSDAVRVLAFLFLGAEPPVLGTECVLLPGCPDNPARCGN